MCQKVQIIMEFLIIILIIELHYAQSASYTEKKTIDLLSNNKASWVNDGWYITKNLAFSKERTIYTGEKNVPSTSQVIQIPSFEAETLSLLSPYNVAIVVPDWSSGKVLNFNAFRNEIGWTQLTLISKNHTLDVYENTNLVHSWTLVDRIIANVTILSERDLVWKLHGGEYVMATTPSNDSSTNSIELDEAWCFILEVDLCDTCYLEVFRFGNSILNITSQVSLQKQKLQFQERDVIKFSRRTTSMVRDTFWGLNIKPCNLDLDAPVGERNTITVIVISVTGILSVIIICIMYIKRNELIEMLYEYFDVHWDHNSVRSNEEQNNEENGLILVAMGQHDQGEFRPS